MSDEQLYKVDIKTPASPKEVANFCELLEQNGYEVTTDLDIGKLKVQDGDRA
jgi:hypothetical protein